MRKALLNARIERNLTQEEVAQKAGISQNDDIFLDSSVS